MICAIQKPRFELNALEPYFDAATMAKSQIMLYNWIMFGTVAPH